jgi:Icc protein
MMVVGPPSDEASIMLIAQITDLHLLAKGGLAYGAVDTAAYAHAALAALSKLEPRPDML